MKKFRDDLVILGKVAALAIPIAIGVAAILVWSVDWAIGAEHFGCVYWIAGMPVWVC